MESTGMAGAAAEPRPGAWLARIASTATYDRAVRVLFFLWYGFIAAAVWRGFLGYLHRPHNSDSTAQFVSTAAANVVLLIFFATFVGFAMFRRRPVVKCAGLAPRLAAAAGTFMLLILPLFPRRALSADMNLLATSMVAAGNCLAIYAVIWLGRSVSVMPEARRLVTGGPYRYLRHPLYLAEELAVIGIFIQYASPWTAALCAAHGLLQLLRMSYEEGVLERAFPGAYGAYAERTARLIPGLY